MIPETPPRIYSVEIMNNELAGTGMDADQLPDHPVHPEIWKFKAAQTPWKRRRVPAGGVQAITSTWKK